MRTTFDLPDALYRELKIVSAQRGVSMRDLVQEFLQRGLSGSSAAVSSGKAKPLTGFPSISTGGRYPKNLSSNADLFELLGKTS